MIKFGVDKKIPEIENLTDKIAKLEELTGISVRDYMGFGKRARARIHYAKNNIFVYIGEVN